MKVYPWNERHYRSTTRALSGTLRKVARVLWPVAAIVSLGLTLIPRAWASHRFARINDHWAKRGLFIALVGLILWPFIGTLAHLGGAWANLIRTIDGQGDASIVGSVIAVALAGLPTGLIIQGFASMIESFDFDVAGERYLLETKPTWAMKRRYKKNMKALASGEAASDGMMPFGVVVGDPIPFRTARYGMLFDRLFATLGHLSVIGSNGTGKTLLALSMARAAVRHGSPLVYIDFKASLRTYNSVKAIAEEYGAPFASFTSGIAEDAQSWYDPLAWKGDAPDKASMLVTSFNFPETGDASYYRNQAETWLVLCLQVLEHVGLREGESTFDYLLAVTNPVELKGRLAPMRTATDPQTRELYQEFMERAERGSPKDLSGLYANLSTVVHSGGSQLRPKPGVKPLSLGEAARTDTVTYIGLSPAVNDVALKILGSLVLRDLSVLAGQRMKDRDVSELKPLPVIVDEASRLGSRSVVMETVLATAREGMLLLWNFTQSFSSWVPSTIKELTTNANTTVAFRTMDPETARILNDQLGEVDAINEISEVSINHRHFQGDTTKREDEAKKIMTKGPFLMNAPHRLDQLPDLHAYIWAAGDLSDSKVMQWRSRRVKNPDLTRDAPLIRVTLLEQPALSASQPQRPAAAPEPQLEPAEDAFDAEYEFADQEHWAETFTHDAYDDEAGIPSWDRPPQYGDSLDDGPAPMGDQYPRNDQYPRRTGSTAATPTSGATTTAPTTTSTPTTHDDGWEGYDATEPADGIVWDDDPSPEQPPAQDAAAPTAAIWDDEPSPLTPAGEDTEQLDEFAPPPAPADANQGGNHEPGPSQWPPQPPTTTSSTTPPATPSSAPKTSKPKKGSKAARWE